MFDQFQLEATQLTQQVQELLASADHVETRISGFRSDLVKKTTSLKAVWDKFLQRVANRGMVLSGALAFYSAKEEVRTDLIFTPPPSPSATVARPSQRPLLPKGQPT